MSIVAPPPRQWRMRYLSNSYAVGRRIAAWQTWYRQELVAPPLAYYDRAKAAGIAAFS